MVLMASGSRQSRQNHVVVILFCTIFKHVIALKNLIKAAGPSVVDTNLLGLKTLRITVIFKKHITLFPLCTTPCGRFVHGS